MPYSGLDEREVEHTSVYVYITGNPDIVLSVGQYYSVNIFDGTDQGIAPTFQLVPRR